MTVLEHPLTGQLVEVSGDPVLWIELGWIPTEQQNQEEQEEDTSPALLEETNNGQK